MIPPPVLWTVVVLGVIAIGYYLIQVFEEPVVRAHQIDLFAYRVAGERVLDGVSLYDTPLIGTTKGVFEFVYSPFSALAFIPVVALSGTWFTVIGSLINFAIMAGVVWLAFSWLGYVRDARLAVVSVAVAGVLLWCEPIRQTVIFGQVNLVLLALVLVDLALPDRVRWKGALIGIAAGIKLIPAFFVLYLLVTKRFRAAAVAGAAFVGTVVLGFLFLPKDSWQFWTGAFLDPARVGVPDHPANETLKGMIARTLGVGPAQQLLWVAVAGAVAVIGLLLARRLSLGGRELAAVLVCGLVSTAVSPFSWPHHWVWLGLLLVYLLHLSLRRGAVFDRFALAVTWVASMGGVLPLLGAPVPTVMDFPSWRHLGVIYHNVYVWLVVAIFVVVLLRIRRENARLAELESALR
ncbi:glycosyltransferase 87 family protein [Kibdelosporangium aridum]|uniref:Alpha-1,2-mannosyltransferase n=1 Tax=Kibdelosporangium aridum TaxID=2030 RepID=A0A1Y5X112_KIBAR|nr:glycosyltransferase 87 family protein [Kibdelosporangium aridum]SMC64163.1 alpha-1,2-mannosyltransferase [Kibdelosporangium aridum]